MAVFQHVAASTRLTLSHLPAYIGTVPGFADSPMKRTAFATVLADWVKDSNYEFLDGLE